MTEDQIADLKQFIAQVVSNEVSGAESSLGKRLDKVESRLDAKIDGVKSSLSKRLDAIEEDVHDIKVMQNEILDAIGHDIEEVKSVQHDHDVRLKKLETKAA